MSFCKIGIIGLGLMGGSIYKALLGKREVLIGEDVLDRLDEIDVLILAVPISAVLELKGRIAQKQIRRRLVVCDIGSVKEEIANRFEEWSHGLIEWIATHPMAGKEQSGFDASDPTLFHNAPWVITPHRKNSETALQALEELIILLGACPLRMAADLHDQRAALISHVPYILSKAILQFASEEDPESLNMAGPGFRSMIRLAQDNPAMRTEIAKYNKTNIQATLKRFIDFLEKIE
jgi:prephenate dehydrogenase